MSETSRGRRSAPVRSVFLGPLEISGYYANLEAGFLETGVEARLVTLYPNPFGYEQAQRNPWPARAAHAWVLRHRRWPAPMRLVSGSLFVLSSVALLLWTLPRFSHYVFSWGTSILPMNADLLLLRLLRKTVVTVVGHGSEARPPYMSTQQVGISAADLAAQTDYVYRHVRRVERWSDIVVGLPTTSQFLSRPFVDFYSLGLPTPQAQVADSPAQTTAVVVLHVPSKPEVKGTALIRAAMSEVRATRPHVTYVELTGVPHAEILSAIEASTIVVDQAFSDIPMAVVGTEAASRGVPSVIGGYGWELWERLRDNGGHPPAVTCAPEDLARTIGSVVDDPSLARDTGRDARAFVATRWTCSAVAQRFLDVLQGQAHPTWIVDPHSVSYAWGCGVSRERVNELVTMLVNRDGVPALRWDGAAAAYGLDQAEAEPNT